MLYFNLSRESTPYANILVANKLNTNNQPTAA